MTTTSDSHIPCWLAIAAHEIQVIMQCWGCDTLSSLHKNGIVDYTTLKKLDPENLNPTLQPATVQHMLVKLYKVAAETLEGQRREQTMAQLTQSLMRVAAAAMELTEADRRKIEKRRRINRR